LEGISVKASRHGLVGYPGVKQPPTSRGKEMKRQLTAIIEREGNGYVSLCPELDIASQGDTIEEARKNLQEALELFFEAASKEEIKDRLREEVYITQVEVAVG
jgi:predicted RNase H-like HicB family nuclease